MVSLLEIIWQALGQFCTTQYSLGNQNEATFVAECTVNQTCDNYEGTITIGLHDHSN